MRRPARQTAQRPTPGRKEGAATGPHLRLADKGVRGDGMPPRPPPPEPARPAGRAPNSPIARATGVARRCIGRMRRKPTRGCFHKAGPRTCTPHEQSAPRHSPTPAAPTAYCRAAYFRSISGKNTYLCKMDFKLASDYAPKPSPNWSAPSNTDRNTIPCWALRVRARPSRWPTSSRR